RPYTQWLRREMRLIVRTTRDPSSIVSSVRQQVVSIDPELPLSDVSTIEQAMARSLSTTTFTNWLLLSFAAAALVLAITGIYGVMSVDVAGRTKEFGIRLALGAQSSSVLGIVLRQGLKLALLGVSIGVVASLALTRLMRGVLFGINETDPMTFVVISTLLVLVALLACVVPARRATRVDPLEALRYE
ncbi:MAG TPA: FtsX-like permease family protein, partial [Pyrinomonadaceae bacterium]|nr:FtsX-like permease family protein [Pyrinomonadaceae bacterium]